MSSDHQTRTNKETSQKGLNKDHRYPFRYSSAENIRLSRQTPQIVLGEATHEGCRSESFGRLNKETKTVDPAGFIVGPACYDAESALNGEQQGCGDGAYRKQDRMVGASYRPQGGAGLNLRHGDAVNFTVKYRLERSLPGVRNSSGRNPQ